MIRTVLKNKNHGAPFRCWLLFWSGLMIGSLTAVVVANATVMGAEVRLGVTGAGWLLVMALLLGAWTGEGFDTIPFAERSLNNLLRRYKGSPLLLMGLGAAAEIVGIAMAGLMMHGVSMLLSQLSLSGVSRFVIMLVVSLALLWHLPAIVLFVGWRVLRSR